MPIPPADGIAIGLRSWPKIPSPYALLPLSLPEDGTLCEGHTIEEHSRPGHKMPAVQERGRVEVMLYTV